MASMLRSRMYLGEIHFGALHNTCAHEPIITDRALFERVQRRTVTRGRQAKSERRAAKSIEFTERTWCPVHEVWGMTELAGVTSAASSCSAARS